MSEANSELLLLFLKVTQVLTKKLPQRTERKRSSIEFERSETKGNFSFPGLLIILNFLNAFKWLESLMNKGF
ncbi:hypothetical protein [Acinetobacter baumannii]|uniref:hypothetical protein n=1 Tax=Acinetobacter baumannii TaxID=470 RepID=UPI00148F08F1|nr:hypothetical protein [Acinetobacter baumannii]